MIILGKADALTKNYVRNPVIFADIFNQYLYQGKQVIRPQDLREMDTALNVVPERTGKQIQKYRDVLKLFTMMTDGRMIYCILGIEDQWKVHYAVPVKNGVYDFLQLDEQVSARTKELRRKQPEGEADAYRGDRNSGESPLSGAEYLSGFRKDDKLIPVVTIVIFWSAEEWDGPLNLRDMYMVQDETILKYAADYHVNLIAPNNMSDAEIGEFQTDMKQIMKYIKYSKNKERLAEIVQSDEGYSSMDRQSAEIISMATNSGLNYQEERGRVNVCQAILDMRKESEEIGEARGKVQGEATGTARTTNRFNKLILKLSDCGRLGDIAKSASDPEYQKKLFAEFNL